MKTFIFLAVSLLLSDTYASASACPDIIGNYICPKEAEQDIAFGKSRYTKITKTNIGEIYTWHVGEEATLFEVGGWNPAMNPETGEVDYSIGTLAECKDNKVLFKMAAMEDGVKIESVVEVSKINNGINLTLKIEGDEFYNYNCLNN